MKLSTIEAFKHIKSRDAIELTPDQLCALQTMLNEVLDDIITVCDRHGINYNLGGGTCLGAVRHHGFIPWDDDIDINMPRKDHDRFVEIFEQECGDKYWVHTARKTKGYGLALSRVLRKGTSVKTREDFWNDECGAFVDIFIIENTFDNKALRMIHGAGAMGLGFAQSCRKFYRDRKPIMNLVNNGMNGDLDDEYRKVFRTKIFLGFLIAWLSLDTWTRILDHWYSLCRNENSKYVTVPSGRGHFFGELYMRDAFCETVPMLYDGKERKVCRDYDTYLRRMYGDYMTIPKEEEQEKHVFFAPFYL